MKTAPWIATLLALPMLGLAKPCEFEFEYVGPAVQTEGMHVWGSSPVIGPDGKVHLYVAQWPIDSQPDFDGWFKDCEIAHYVGDKPEGPFELVRVAVPDQDGTFNSPHNPTIQHIDGKYVLCFIVNENNKLATQRIIMYVADDLNDAWKPAAGAEQDGTILRKSAEPTDWNHTAKLGVSNPSLIKFNGKYMLYIKAVLPNGGGYTYGVAVSDSLEGPYKNHPKKVTRGGIEDAYAFTMDGTVYLLSRNFGHIKGGSHGGGLLWTSADGFWFPKDDVELSFEPLSHYVGTKELEAGTKYRPPAKVKDYSGRLERPQILMKDGEPAYVYMATGISTRDGYGSCSHVFKMKKK
ncbi:glycoside hydrolase family protein [Pontiella sp.]|uniref:glycoside hydrolase family protein n=1 Tax=Pontiella sp. TaxID=2837462 RepID=UPI0035630FC2